MATTNRSRTLRKYLTRFSRIAENAPRISVTQLLSGHSRVYRSRRRSAAPCSRLDIRSSCVVHPRVAITAMLQGSMTNIFSLTDLSDERLLTQVRMLAAHERQATTDPRTQMPVPHRSQTVHRIIWIDFNFEGENVSALRLLQHALTGVRAISVEVEKWL